MLTKFAKTKIMEMVKFFLIQKMKSDNMCNYKVYTRKAVETE